LSVGFKAPDSSCVRFDSMTVVTVMPCWKLQTFQHMVLSVSSV